MPKLSGIELVQRLRQDRPDLPVVLMSGYPAADDGASIPDDVVFLQKPFEPARLLAAIESAFEGKTEESVPVA